ncbi:unnamed protein product [Dovyalis caffra]|uniref:Subtilisin-like protease n=1 Tax=Dovyalis caffra TaxID=77055 RepID=A0AAV1SCI3_9ROSI|nr:unnamed protein product [Dovyalis caffra]
MFFRICFLFLAFIAAKASAASMDKQTYIIHMDKTKMPALYDSLGNSRQCYESLIDSISQLSSQEPEEEQETTFPQLLYTYETVTSGFAAMLSTKQVEALSRVSGFLSAIPDEMLTLHTTHTPQFLGLQRGIGLWDAQNLASDVIVGILDTGIWPEHVSFQDSGMSAVPLKWKGTCESGTKFSPSDCNKKLIGARAFFKGYEVIAGRINETIDYRSPRDSQGKGTAQLPLVYAGTAGGEGAKYCISGSLKKKLVIGKIVVCERGINGRAQKGEQVKLAGGAGMLLINTETGGEELFADAHVLPATSLGASAGTAVKQYTNSSIKATASIAFKGTVYGDPAPMVAAFSSRGPSLVGPGVIKPDVTAPGVNILAAWPSMTSPTLLKSDKRSVLFNIISGTSMSCPHVSGLAVLLKSVHKEWSPAAIKSALMTTAYATDNRKSPIADVGSISYASATPFAYGSGHVDPESASDPGLIYDITIEDYVNYLCSLNYTSSQMALVSRSAVTCPDHKALQPGDLNYPSFAVNFEGNAQNNRVTYNRTLTNVGSPSSTYAVSVEEPNGVSVIVEPKSLSFEKLGQKLIYQVTFVNLGGKATVIFGISLFLLAFMAARASAPLMDKKTYVIQLDKTKMSASYQSLPNSKQWYESIIDSITKFTSQEQEEDLDTAPIHLLYTYETVISGFAVKLSSKQAEALRRVNGFLSAIPDEMLTLHTTNIPDFLGLRSGRGLRNAQNLASDVIFGFLETEIWPELVNFQDSGMCAVPSKWKGTCKPTAQLPFAYAETAGGEDASLNYTSPQVAQVSRSIVNCPGNQVLQPDDLNYPSFSVNFKGKAKTNSLTYRRTLTNATQLYDIYRVKVEELNGVSVTLKHNSFEF